MAHRAAMLEREAALPPFQRRCHMLDGDIARRPFGLRQCRQHFPFTYPPQGTLERLIERIAGERNIGVRIDRGRRRDLHFKSAGGVLHGGFGLRAGGSGKQQQSSQDAHGPL